MISNTSSQRGINHEDLYNFIIEHSNEGFEDKFKSEDMLHLIEFHSHNKDGYLSFTDFNQMVLPTSNNRLRAMATQRTNVIP